MEQKKTKRRAKKVTGEGPVKAPELPTNDNLQPILINSKDNIETMVAQIAGGLIAKAKLTGDERDDQEIDWIAQTAVLIARHITKYTK
jgi:hypothetical protein